MPAQLSLPQSVASALIAALIAGAVSVVVALLSYAVQTRRIEASLTEARRNQVQLAQVNAYQRLWSLTAAIRTVLDSTPEQEDELRQRLKELDDWYNGGGNGLFLPASAHDRVQEVVQSCKAFLSAAPEDKRRLLSSAESRIVDLRKQLREDLELFDPRASVGAAKTGPGAADSDTF